MITGKKSKLFGSVVFNESIMKERLPRDAYEAVRRAIELNEPISTDVANVVANAMKDWALEHGATHYTHWFQPMTGVTAEKHDSFMTPSSDGTAIAVFSGKALIKGESDASSFPSGGLRATFEARGYTAWDPTSYAFIKDGTLCIPTVFCSYGGEALDKKTPLLRSMAALNTQAQRVLRLFGRSANRIISTVGAEQEYFLVDKELYEKRRDLVFTGRTLFGAKPPKGQDLDDHYYGAIKPHVSAFMRELDEELWRLGVSAKTEHNEAAPAQHELACMFSSANIETDHNQLVMEMMKVVANRHNLVCLLHEKPFDGLNGSGKHNNWSLSTDTGYNLLEPGSSPAENAQFLLFLCAVIKAVDEHQDLLRASVATAGNDCRLGGNEAPPAIISIFLGDELAAILDAIESGTQYNAKEREQLEIGVDVLPAFPKDTTDRNRTSPFAFTGNKFEFRMPGSSLSVSEPNIVINTIVAEALCQYADILESAENFTEALNVLIRQTIKEHKRIIFNGNNYSNQWREEAKKRGLLSLPSAADALPLLISEENIALFKKHHVFSEIEMHSRCEIFLENYYKAIIIEALTMIEMSKREILPACYAYIRSLSEAIVTKNQLPFEAAYASEQELVIKLSKLCDKLYKSTLELENIASADHGSTPLEIAQYTKNIILPAMAKLRSTADELECNTAEAYWPFPTYGKLLFKA